MANYPPYQQPLLEPRTGRLSRPWHLFLLSLASGGQLTEGTITLDKLVPIASPRLLGRGSAGTGAVEVIALGAGLTMTGTTLAVSGGGVAAAGYWTPITNGDPLSPEILFDSNGDAIVGFVPTA